MINSLHDKIEKKDAKICVIGLGQVGLPTALTFSSSGYTVIGHDINKSLISDLSLKKPPFYEPGLDDLLTESIDSKKFLLTDQLVDAVEKSDVIIVCVATPITTDIRPDLSYLEKACRSLSQFSLVNKLIIIESSIPPGTFEELVLPILTQKNKLGTEFWVSFVPERLAPGRAFTEIQTTSRVIGYVDKDSGILAKELYGKIVKGDVLLAPVQVAEISKLVENTYRDVNVALANEVSMICEEYGIDVSELIKICNSHPRVKMLLPGPGVGGPCLPKDPYLLLNPQGKKPITSRIILESRKINDNMPYHVVDLIKEALESQHKTLKDITILVLGVAYKANVSDTRFSPAAEIISQLIKNGSTVLVFDPNTKESFGGMNISDIWASIPKSDVLVILTDHDEFRKLDLKEISKCVKENTILVDTRRIFNRIDVEKLGIKYVSIGCSIGSKHK
jgi:UDP-N-acetyl-D-mannosaminuronic acid dehydrogenase